MDMILMLVLLAAIYFTSLILICLYRTRINVKIGNWVFIGVDIVFYFLWNLGMYESNWKNDIYNTLANISPMIFTVIPLTCVLNEKAKKWVHNAIAFLWVGMFVALFISPQSHYVANFGAKANLVYTGEALCHLTASLFGIYLILTKQVQITFQSWYKSLSFLYAVILWGVLCNFAFHLDNFGMNPYGDYSIYFIDIFGSFTATFLAYLLGVLLVVTLGMQAGMLLDRLTKPKTAIIANEGKNLAVQQNSAEQQGADANDTFLD